MRILFRYVLREHIKIFAICLSSLLLIYLSIDFFGKIGKFLQRDPEWISVAIYFALRIPRILFDVTPIANLLSTLITLGIFSKYNEIVAMKSHGISLLRLTAPLLLFSLLLSGLMLASNLTFIPWIKTKADYVRVVDIKKRPEIVFYGTEKLWVRDGKRNFINANWVDPENNTLHQFKYYRIREDFSLEESFTANKAVFIDGRWIMVDGIHRTYSSSGVMKETPFSKKPIFIKQKPEELKGFDVKTGHMSFAKLQAYIGVLKEQTYAIGRFQVDLYEKVSFPFVNFVMTLLAIPLGLAPVRGAGISRGIGLCLLLGSGYWIFHSLSIAMGHALWLPPLMAAVLPNILFGGIGGFLFLSARS